MGIACIANGHDWDGCQCRRCGATRHEFMIVSDEVIGADACCWDSDEPCTGPLCGSHCDSYYPGRSGKRRIVEQCRLCGLEQTREEEPSSM